jgi:hypothetical protein
MPAERLSMRKVREVLRLKYACGASDRVIARSVGIGRTAVGEYIRRAAVVGITWPVPAELDDTALERKLFAPAGYNPAAREAAAGLEPCPCRAAAARRDAGAAVGGVSGRRAGRLRLQPVLRPVRGMAPRDHRDDAANPRGGREAVRGFCRRHRAGVSMRSPARHARPRSSSRFWRHRTTPTRKPA